MHISALILPILFATMSSGDRRTQNVSDMGERVAGGQFDSNTWYRLTNTYLGYSQSLDVENDNGANSSGTLMMAASGSYSGQYWQLIPQSPGVYKLRTEFLGPDRVLDVWGDDKTKPHLAEEGNYSGQLWTIESWGDGTWKLTNSYSGPDLHLDTYSDTHEPFLGDGDHTGQHWNINAIESISG
ncbi:hypothetical protein J3459_008307 [Metarhizium acridum]|uniref:Carbohydrate-binding module family 13 protein n=1 Tax=Metarhizium acridum (strain CQMa 102) TaxID=655827 RepID=E9EHW2_METAQ|nr:carbohydrate-binding module family 13 protein [Metarhizium acridum CQMa 102]EFY84485.1 carbohydrate-binding module family 13 protein [Metarhizium acridum CQMa 102]KAG8423099.1 hypothetical protein J3458_000019 [Metarhizium acridum]KAG8426243.1 hypothetical protein J3459_008307 [Metarhizium acridum]